MSVQAICQPAYQRHKATGQAKVRIDGHDFYLGPHGSPASRERYDDLIAEWRIRNVDTDRYTLTVDDLALSYLEFAKQHYVKDGKPTSEVCCLKNALRFVIAAAGRTRAREFGPKLLKAVRQRMIDAGLCRKTINTGIGRIRRMFRWAVAEELVPANVLTAIAAVTGLQAGRSNAAEGRIVNPVSRAAVDAIKSFVSKPVWAAVELQMLTGMRSGETLAMRGRDINTTGTVWEYRPESHKTQHHGKGRVVFLGPKAQAIVKEFLTTDLKEYLFNPGDAVRVCGPVGKVYRRDAYRRAITRACERAFGMPHELRYPRHKIEEIAEAKRAAEVKRRRMAAAEWRREHCWFPHQLRHSFATNLRRQAGIETTRCCLGHSELSTTQIYAEADMERARDIMGKVG